MCGIVAALPDYDSETERVADRQLLDVLPEPPTVDPGAGRHEPRELAAGLEWLTKELAAAVELYSVPAAGHCLAAEAPVRDAVASRVELLGAWLAASEKTLDDTAAAWDADLLERTQRLAVRARDLLWTIEHDRVAAAGRVATLARGGLSTLTGARAYLAIDTVLDAVDRLEVRGRDSAGLQVWVTLDDADTARLPAGLRTREDAEYRHGAVAFFPGGLSLVYKRASIIGRLGDNVAFLRAAITADDDLHAVLALPSARATVVAHTRWASVGRISEANAHPVDSFSGTAATTAKGYATASLNGDIDNHVELREQVGLPASSTGISTDAQLIPVMLAEQIDAGLALAPAMAACVRRYHGSFAIAAQSDRAPGQLVLAVRGSGQGMYVGFASGCFLVAS
ncbi:MAG: hypothetical protein ACM30G_03150, partial [Micromonosporaceae bacterium]